MAGAVLLLSALLGGCSDSPLQPRVCDPGELRCTPAGLVESCVPAGTGWLASFCPVGQVCIATTCDGAHHHEAGCRPVVCEPGETRCNPDDNLRIESCDATGTDWCCTASCADSDSVCYEGRCVGVCSVGDKSYIGCEYFAADLDNAYVRCGGSAGSPTYCDAAGSQYAVVLANPDPLRRAVYMVSNGPVEPRPQEEVCELPSNVVTAGVLEPNGLAVVELPRRDVNGTTKGLLAYRIASNTPITAYQFNPLQNEDVFSNDASLLLPTNTAGNKYRVMTREQSSENLKGFLTVIGITPVPANVTVTVTAKTLPGNGIPALEPGESFVTTLSRYEVLNIETNAIGADLTGSLVESDEPVVVFGGSEAANAPNTSRCDLDTMTCEWDGLTSCACPDDEPSCNPHAECTQLITCCADHLEQQLFPMAAWGTEYVAVRSKQRVVCPEPPEPCRPEKDVWRILAAEDDTRVSLQPALVTLPTLAAGEWFELESDEDFVISSNKPILVGQFLAAEQAPDPGYDPEYDAGTGDPAFILAVPARQLRTHYVFLAPDKYAQDFVSIAAPATAVVRLDGKDLQDLDPERYQLEQRDIPGTSWRAYRLAPCCDPERDPSCTTCNPDGEHTLYCSEPCSVMVHGYDQYVSYGYPGGLDLED